MDRRTFLISSGVVALAVGGATPAFAATVTSLAELQQAIDSATAGTTITVANGTYAVPSGSPITISGRHGSSTAPITIVAQSRGGVTLTGEQSFVFSGSSDVTISGFAFRQGTTLEIPADCPRIRLTRNDFQLATAAGQHWVVVRGDDAKIDRNTFHDKSTAGVYLVIDGPGTEAMAQRTYILRNYFRDHTYAGANGGEPIRLGVSARALSTADATVEYNLFERCNGDPEAISVKSSGNLVRYNTVRSSVGGIVLRHGNGTRVESNYLVAGSNGIRIYGNDHLIVNNYVDGVGSAGVVLGSGTERDHYEGEPSSSRTGNDAPDRVTIVLNTLRNNGQAVEGESQRTVPPLDCVIADNLMVGNSGDLVTMPYLDGITWSGNITWGAATDGNMPAAGFTRADPKLVAGSDGVCRLGAGSAAINATSLNHSTQVTDDVDGEPRTAPYDVGADEYSTTQPLRRPLTATDVGPNAA
ncbi:polysaccharide lyase 6 family protein [Kribbella sp.]|uniref:polysaccharide lyase 6 family protein n=1 Tax=Kribbella sp. TaxID=1871183 RepID=UPI002D6AB8C4|nr:polysaccharide lyase 6 family protein [Kribbella sp.]HZX01867.1 polysaccharide lyase 6 family protein [Kribbella sp.]